jgi:twinkle protein
MSEHPHKPCPFTSCKSSDAFSWNDGGYGSCKSCGQSYPPKGMRGLKDWALEEYPVKQQVDVRSLPVSGITYDGIRGIDPDVCKLYNIQLQVADDGTPVRYAFKHNDNIKYRGYDEKVFWLKEKGKGLEDLFGPEFNSGTSKKIFITEGEFDAASLYQILGKTYPVVSLPSASIGEKFVKKNYKYLSTFQEIVYAGELDDAGKKAAELIYAAFPKNFYYVPMSQHKDANEFLMAGAGDTLKWAAIKPQRYTPDNFFCSDEAVDLAIRTENPYEYVPTGHSGIDEKCRGLVKGGLTFIKAPRGMGKTEVVRFFEMAMLRDPDERIALLHMEEMKSTTYRAMATYELGFNVRTKDDAKYNSVTEDNVIKAAQKATDGERTIIFEMRVHDNPMKLLDYVRLASSVYGAGYIFIDHVQRLAYLSDAGVDGATSTLTSIGAQMAQLAKELNIGVVFISQVNEDGRTKYAGALEEEAIICIQISRDVDSEDEIEQNTTHFKIDKNRPFAKLGDAGSLFYDSETTILREGF